MKLTKEGILTTDIHSFLFDVLSIHGPLSGRFEWRDSKGPEVKTFAIDDLGKGNYIGDERLEGCECQEEGARLCVCWQEK